MFSQHKTFRLKRYFSQEEFDDFENHKNINSSYITNIKARKEDMNGQE